MGLEVVVSEAFVNLALGIPRCLTWYLPWEETGFTPVPPPSLGGGAVSLQPQRFEMGGKSSDLTDSPQEDCQTCMHTIA